MLVKIALTASIQQGKTMNGNRKKKILAVILSLRVKITNSFTNSSLKFMVGSSSTRIFFSLLSFCCCFCSLAKPFDSRKTYKLTIYLAGCYVYTGSQYAVVKRSKKKEYSSGREGREQKDFIRGLEKFSLIGVLGFAQSRVTDSLQSH